ncbi:MAG: phosphohydrolase [Raineya sp.]|nr:phosphohydrolase [Raineya sp.]
MKGIYDEKEVKVINWNVQMVLLESSEGEFLVNIKDFETNFKQDNLLSINSEIVVNAQKYAVKCHTETNHTYDNLPYEVHLRMVYDFGVQFEHLLPQDTKEYALATCWTHDTIEDCRQTYNDVKTACGEQVAELTYALTNLKGKNRKERAGDAYYEGIRNTPMARFVKLCDRLANVKYSLEKGDSRMWQTYKQENPHFTTQLYESNLQEMFDELEKLFQN